MIKKSTLVLPPCIEFYNVETHRSVSPVQLKTAHFRDALPRDSIILFYQKHGGMTGNLS